MALEDMKARLKALKQKQADGQRKPKVEELDDEELEDVEEDEEEAEDLDDEEQDLVEDANEAIESAEKALKKKTFKPQVNQAQRQALKAVDEHEEKKAQEEQQKLIDQELKNLHNNAYFRYRLIAMLKLMNDNLTEINRKLGE